MSDQDVLMSTYLLARGLSLTKCLFKIDFFHKVWESTSSLKSIDRSNFLKIL